jgi:hypothetical protein
MLSLCVHQCYKKIQNMLDGVFVIKQQLFTYFFISGMHAAIILRMC